MNISIAKEPYVEFTTKYTGLQNAIIFKNAGATHYRVNGQNKVPMVDDHFDLTGHIASEQKNGLNVIQVFGAMSQLSLAKAKHGSVLDEERDYQNANMVAVLNLKYSNIKILYIEYNNVLKIKDNYYGLEFLSHVGRFAEDNVKAKLARRTDEMLEFMSKQKGSPKIRIEGSMYTPIGESYNVAKTNEYGTIYETRDLQTTYGLNYNELDTFLIRE